MGVEIGLKLLSLNPVWNSSDLKSLYAEALWVGWAAGLLLSGVYVWEAMQLVCTSILSRALGSHGLTKYNLTEDTSFISKMKKSGREAGSLPLPFLELLCC